MKLILFFLASIIILFSLNSWKKSDNYGKFKPQAREYILAEINQLTQIIDKSIASINEGDSSKLVALYHQGRKHYKHIEFFIEQVSPFQAKYYINGPLVPKYLLESEAKIIQPHGFQLIELKLFQEGVMMNKEVLLDEYFQLKTVFEQMENYFKTVQLQDILLIEMFQLELYRIASMNFNGYDATITKSNILETSWVLESMRDLLIQYADNKQSEISSKISKQFSKSIRYLKRHSKYDSFNRLYFITRHINELNKLIRDFHTSLSPQWSDNRQAINLNSANLFIKESFNPRFFSLYFDDTVNNKIKADLGKILFFDPIISSDNKRACASCHKPDKGFTDGYEKSIAFNQNGSVGRNAPTILNVLFQKTFFYDGKALQLEQQVFDVVHNKAEMNSNLEDVVKKLRKSSEYKDLFKLAFGNSKEGSISVYAIQKAIVEYEKTLISLNSRFDKFLKGDNQALTRREKKGYNLFAGKALCGSCHFFPLFNGTVPPIFNDSEYEVIGTSSTKDNKELDADIGRYSVTKMEEHKFAFKTPTVRNITITGPYMHNGKFSTLEEIVDFYQKGGGVGFGYKMKNQTLPFDSLLITKREKNDIVLFLKCLTDTIGLIPSRFNLPKFESENEWNKRIWGGEY